ncbi:hypothetical protein HKBW3C_01213, partial [Candidatus Hakubella thermalkaliphila]
VIIVAVTAVGVNLRALFQRIADALLWNFLVFTLYYLHEH